MVKYAQTKMTVQTMGLSITEFYTLTPPGGRGSISTPKKKSTFFFPNFRKKQKILTFFLSFNQEYLINQNQ